MAKRKVVAKAYLVHVSGGSDAQSYLLMGVTQETFMGMRCIRGFYGSRSKSHFMADRVVHVPCDRVHLIVEYDSHEAYKDALRKHDKEKSK